MFHGPLIYPAKIKAVFHPETPHQLDTKLKTLELLGIKGLPPRNTELYYVHYNGWDKEWDEWVGLERMLPYTKENIRKSKELVQSAIHSSGRREIEIATVKKPDTVARFLTDSIDRTEVGKLMSKHPVFTLDMPVLVRRQLVDDCRAVCIENKQVKLPTEWPVWMILQKYIDWAEQNHDPYAELRQEFCDNLIKMFGRCEALILYEPERGRDIGGNPAEVYGPEHFLRFLAILPSLVCYYVDGQEGRDTARVFLQNMLRYMEEDHSTLKTADTQHYIIAAGPDT